MAEKAKMQLISQPEDEIVAASRELSKANAQLLLLSCRQAEEIEQLRREVVSLRTQRDSSLGTSFGSSSSTHSQRPPGVEQQEPEQPPDQQEGVAELGAGGPVDKLYEDVPYSEAATETPAEPANQNAAPENESPSPLPDAAAGAATPPSPAPQGGSPIVRAPQARPPQTFQGAASARRAVSASQLSIQPSPTRLKNGLGYTLTDLQKACMGLWGLLTILLLFGGAFVAGILLTGVKIQFQSIFS